MTLDADGFALLPGVFAPPEVAAIVADWGGIRSRHAADAAILAGEGGPAYGARDLLRLWPRVIELARHPPLLSSLRDLLGPTDSRKAAKGTIRGDLGTNNMSNIAHASDSVENAELEVRRFFRPEEIPG